VPVPVRNRADALRKKARKLFSAVARTTNSSMYSWEAVVT